MSCHHLFPPIGCVVPGAGAVEVAIAEALVYHKHSVPGRARLGVQAFADALLIIPKVQPSYWPDNNWPDLRAFNYKLLILPNSRLVRQVFICISLYSFLLDIYHSIRETFF
jgi:hypothetical protein